MSNENLIKRLQDWSDGPDTDDLCREAAAEIEALRADAERYRRLCEWVAIGDWSIARHEIKDSYGLTNDFYMDDKAHADAELDAAIEAGRAAQ